MRRLKSFQSVQYDDKPSGVDKILPAGYRRHALGRRKIHDALQMRNIHSRGEDKQRVSTLLMWFNKDGHFDKGAKIATFRSFFVPFCRPVNQRPFLLISLPISCDRPHLRRKPSS